MRRKVQAAFLVGVLALGTAAALAPVSWRWPCWICRMFPGCSACPEDSINSTD